jgi:hypothetical protein
MADDDEVGYGKPPKHSRFKMGNQFGRHKRKPPAAAEIVSDVLNAPTEYREQGRTRKATRQELTLKTYVKLALSGDVQAAEMLLKLRAHAKRLGTLETDIVEVHDWPPDYPGQTAEQKTREFATQAAAVMPEWAQQSARTCESNPTGPEELDRFAGDSTASPEDSN